MQDIVLPLKAPERVVDAPHHPAQAPMMSASADQAREIGKKLARLAEEAEAAGFHMLAYLIQMAEIEAKTEEAKEQRQ